MLKYVDAIQAIWYSFFEVKFCYRPSRKSPILHFQILCLGLYELCKLAWNWCFKIDVLHYYHIILLVLDGLLHQHFSICCFLFSRALYVNTPWLWISCIGTRGLTERAFFFYSKELLFKNDNVPSEEKEWIRKHCHSCFFQDPSGESCVWIFSQFSCVTILSNFFHCDYSIKFIRLVLIHS
jgi:hypothetical protein